jgi:RimJ/RimL family protein N-acetyltransferase
MRIPEKLGYRREGLLRRRLEPRDDEGRLRDFFLFTMVREELEDTPCVRYEYVAYDALGRSI